MQADNTTATVEAKRRWVILGVATLSCLAFATTMQSVPPILSLIMAEFQLTYAQGGLLMSLFALPGIAISIPAGMLTDRYGQKTIGITCFALMIVGTAIFASGNSLPVLILGRVVAGAGALTILVLAPQLLAQWFAGREMGTAMGD
jgi:CP family cyanate transporter-like MFS transporter